MKDIEIKKENLKHGDIVWACAFDVDMDRKTWNRETVVHLKCEPVKGMIVSFSKNHIDTSWRYCEFAVLKNSGEPIKSGRVSLNARRFTHTYEDCVKLFNSIIDEKIEFLQEQIYKLHETKISLDEE